MNPVIGIVICGLAENRQFVSASYVEAIEASGGIPVLIPRICNFDCFRHYLTFCSGFLFCGGDDVSPRLLGEDLQTDRGHTDEKTDVFHLAFMRYILLSSAPILGICRGMQVMNLAAGGSIYQDISLREGTSLCHMQHSADRGEPCHRVSFACKSLLYDICGSYLETNSYHHQCIKDVGTGLRITGVTADGIFEVLEASDHPFRVGLQWHPECMYLSCPAMAEIFERFILSAKKLCSP